MVIVLFYIERNPAADSPEYRARASRLMTIVSKVPGFISIKPFTASDDEMVYIIKFASEDALNAWRNNEEHIEAMKLGKDVFYKSYEMHVCSVTRAYAFPATAGKTRYSEEARRAGPLP